VSTLSRREKLGYSLGEIGSTFGWQGMMFYLGMFYTDVFGLSAGAAGAILFLPRFLDGFVDPMVGAMADRTRSRWGQFRPYLLFAAVPYALLMLLTYSTPSFGPTGKAIYALVTCTAFMIVYSLVAVPFTALGGVLTEDHVERTSLQSYRFMMAFVGGLMVRGLTNPLVKLFGGHDPSARATTPAAQQGLQTGFLWTMGIFGLISIATFLVAFATTRERVSPPKAQRSSLFTDLTDLLGNGWWLLLKRVASALRGLRGRTPLALEPRKAANRPWVAIFGVVTLNLVYVGVFSTAIAYYFKYFVTARSLVLFGRDTGYDLMSTFNVFGSLVIILVLAFPTTKLLVKHLGKRNTLIVGYSLVSLSIAGFWLCGPQDVGLILFCQLVQSAGAAPTMPILWSMYADAADYSEYVNRRRATGLVSSAVGIGLKAGIALGAAIPLWVLQSMAYQPDAPAQSAEVLRAIRLSMSLIPAALAALTVVACLFYRLSDQRMNEIQAELTRRREAERAA
jgi:GPH family glycoside/pentoside/hexuronide:cation symporter